MKTPIPAAAFQQHVIALGKTGAGKSSAIRSAFVEPLLEHSEPLCILDPKGDWWGLKSSADGRRPGYAVVIFGGPHADVPINDRSGAHVAELFATGNRPCIIDLSDFTVSERTRFFMEFAATLYRKNRGKKWVVMDECHNFAPQGRVMDPDSGKALHWANKLASEGRGRGLNLIAASQRPQKVHKDFLTSMETLVAMRVIHNLDRNAIKDWIDGAPDKAIGKEILDQLASMKRGEGWVWSPEINFGPQLIVFPMFKTYDSFKPQEADAGQLAGWASVDLNDVREKLSGLVAEHQANDPKALRKRIADLEEQLERGAPRELAIDTGMLERARQSGYQDAMRAIVARYSDALDAISASLAIHAASVQDIRAQLRAAQDETPLPPTSNVNGRPMTPAEIDSTPGMPDMRYLTERMPPRRAERSPIEISTDSSIPKGEQAILQAYIQHPNGLRRDQLNVLAGYKKSSRDAYIARLMGKGYLETASDGRLRASAAGRKAMPNAQPLPTGRALREHWLQRLPEGERVILAELIDKYPEPTSRSGLDKLGYKKSSRDAYIARLSARGLVKTPSAGKVAASDNLF